MILKSKEMLNYIERINGSGHFKFIYFELVNFLFKNTPGAAGIVFRRYFYRDLFKQCGKGAIINDNVTFRGISKISLEHAVKIDHQAIIDAFPKSKGITLKDAVEIHHAALISSGDFPESLIEIGKESRIGPNTAIYGYGSITIGEKVLIAGGTFIIASQHRFDDKDIPIKDQGVTHKGIVIGDDVWIGCNCSILDGVTIGSGSVIGAGSLVNRDIPEHSVAAGQPAAIIKKRE
jgi:acetyltransferase-like isoleucine patch superfamily enzyme